MFDIEPVRGPPATELDRLLRDAETNDLQSLNGLFENILKITSIPKSKVTTDAKSIHDITPGNVVDIVRLCGNPKTLKVCKTFYLAALRTRRRFDVSIDSLDRTDLLKHALAREYAEVYEVRGSEWPPQLHLQNDPDVIRLMPMVWSHFVNLRELHIIGTVVNTTTERYRSRWTCKWPDRMSIRLLRLSHVDCVEVPSTASMPMLEAIDFEDVSANGADFVASCPNVATAKLVDVQGIDPLAFVGHETVTNVEIRNPVPRDWLRRETVRGPNLKRFVLATSGVTNIERLAPLLNGVEEIDIQLRLLEGVFVDIPGVRRAHLNAVASSLLPYLPDVREAQVTVPEDRIDTGIENTLRAASSRCQALTTLTMISRQSGLSAFARIARMMECTPATGSWTIHVRFGSDRIRGTEAIASLSRCSKFWAQVATVTVPPNTFEPEILQRLRGRCSAQIVLSE